MKKHTVSAKKQWIQCDWCKTKILKNKLRRCTTCYTHYYCNDNCSILHWENGHSNKCAFATSFCTLYGREVDRIIWTKPPPDSILLAFSPLMQKEANIKAYCLSNAIPARPFVQFFMGHGDNSVMIYVNDYSRKDENTISYIKIHKDLIERIWMLRNNITRGIQRIVEPQLIGTKRPHDDNEEISKHLIEPIPRKAIAIDGVRINAAELLEKYLGYLPGSLTTWALIDLFVTKGREGFAQMYKSAVYSNATLQYFAEKRIENISDWMNINIPVINQWKASHPSDIIYDPSKASGWIIDLPGISVRGAKVLEQSGYTNAIVFKEDMEKEGNEKALLEKLKITNCGGNYSIPMVIEKAVSHLRDIEFRTITPCTNTI